MTQNMLMTRKPLTDVITFGGTSVLKIFVALRRREKQRKKSKHAPKNKKI